MGESFPALADALRAIRYVSTATISLVYRRSEVGTPLDGYGLVIPRSEQTWINACTLSSVKFRHRAPDDYLLLRCFAGGSRRPELLACDDDDWCVWRNPICAPFWVSLPLRC